MPRVFLSITQPRRVAGRLRSTILGFATAKLLLPKIIIFGIPQSRDFRRSNFAVAKPTMPTASKKSGGGQRGV